MTTTIATITQALGLSLLETQRVAALLIDQEVTPGRYDVADVLDACREIEGTWQHVLTAEEIVVFAAARHLLPFQIARVQDELRGCRSLGGEYSIIDVLEACLNVEGDVGWAA